LKKQVNITDVLAWLDIKLKPVGDQLVGLPWRRAWFQSHPSLNLLKAFCGRGKGSIIDAALHFKCSDCARCTEDPRGDCRREQYTRVRTCGTQFSPTMTKRREGGTVPPNVSPQASGELKPLDYLTTDHEAIEVLGLSAFACRTLGIGYAPKGTMRGRVVFRMRTVEAKLCGYAGLATRADMAPLVMIPKNLDQMHAAPIEETKQPVGDDVRQFLRVVQ
jgi:hypothetical protein